MLQYVNSFIDTVQGAKTQFVKTYIQDESLAKPIQAFLDQQTTFVKQVAKTTLDVSETLAKNAVKFDAAKMFKKA
jgi:hypothetical protein